MAKLRILWSDGREQEYEISRTVTMIGRTKDNDLKLVDKGISRKQCKIEGSPGNYSVVDLDSRNGTSVNGTRISTSQLKHKDVILIGGIRITFIEEYGDVEAVQTKESGKGCPSCGSPYKEGDVLCVRCGTFINKGSSYFSGSGKIKDTWLSWTILIVVLAALIAAGAAVMKDDTGTEGLSETEVQNRIKSIVRNVKASSGDQTLGEFLDSINVSNSDIDWDIEQRGENIYRVKISFDPGNGESTTMMFKVDLESETGEGLSSDS